MGIAVHADVALLLKGRGLSCILMTILVHAFATEKCEGGRVSSTENRT